MGPTMTWAVCRSLHKIRARLSFRAPPLRSQTLSGSLPGLRRQASLISAQIWSQRPKPCTGKVLSLLSPLRTSQKGRVLLIFTDFYSHTCMGICGPALTQQAKCSQPFTLYTLAHFLSSDIDNQCAADLAAPASHAYA